MRKEAKKGNALPGLFNLSDSGKNIGAIVNAFFIVDFFAPKNHNRSLPIAEVFNNAGKIFCFSGIYGKIFDYFQSIALGFKA